MEALPSLSDALALAPDAVEMIDAGGRYVFVNAAFERLVGMSATEVIGREPAEVFEGPMLEVAYSRAARGRLAAGEAWTETVALAGEGEARVFDVTVSPVRGGAPVSSPCGALVIRRDVTGRARAEAELSQSETRFASMFDNPSVKLLIDPATGRIQDANAAASRFYGYGLEELRRMRITDINTLAEHEVKEEMRRAAEERRDYFRFRHRLASGAVRRVDVFTGPLRFGEETRLLSIIHDVTDLEVALERLAASELGLRELLRRLPVGVAVHTAGRFLYVNDTLADLLGRMPGELVGAPLGDAFPAGDPAAGAELAGVASSGAAVVVRRRLMRKDGSVIAADVSAISFEFEAAPAVLVVFLDVSERERLERQLLRAQRMDAVGRLAGGVAHDFNNLLMVILGSVELCARRTDGDGTLTVHLDRIEEAAKRAADLTRQLLYFSKGAEPSGERVDVNAAITDALRMLGPTLGPGIEVATDLAPLATCAIDRTSLDQLLVNLAVNARDAMPGGGSLRIRTSVVHLDTAEASRHAGLAPGRYVRIEVTDTGTGMTEDVRAHAFEPFYTTKEGRGTGLGLSITYGVVQRAGGAVEIESELGRGATFLVWLPLAGPPPAKAAARPPPPRALAGRTVLLVDDHAAVRGVVERILLDAGYAVLGAASAEEALEILDRHAAPVHLLLTDVIMPKMRGPELARRVAVARPGVCILFMTGFSGDAPDLHGKVLFKPFTEEQLLEAVAEQIGAVTTGLDREEAFR